MSSCIRFRHLDFYGDAGKTGVNERYRQSFAFLKIDVGKQRFHLFDVEPQSMSRQDSKVKQVETNERTRQHQVNMSTNFSVLPWKVTMGGMYGNATARRSGTTEECLVNINRIIQTKTGRDTSWCYFVNDEWVQENGLRGLTPSASFSFFGTDERREKPEKLNIEIKSKWTMPDAGLWDRYTRFVRNIPIRNLATQVIFDIPPHMSKSWTIFRDLDVRIIPRDQGFGVKSRIESGVVYGDKDEAEVFNAFISPVFDDGALSR